MKKKLTLTLSALVCALCCAFGLVACSFFGGGNENNKDNGEKKLPGSEFASAFEAALKTGYTLTYENVDIETEHTFEADVTHDRYLDTIRGRNTQLVWTTEQTLYTKEGDSYKMYMTDTIREGEETYWNKFNGSKDVFDELNTTKAIPVTFHGEKFNEYLDAFLKEQADTLVYNEREEAYFLNYVRIPDKGVAETVKAVYKDGKVLSLSFLKFQPGDLPSNSKIRYNFTFSNFGETSVEIPTDDYIISPRMTADEWPEVLNRFVELKNCSIKLANSVSSGSTTPEKDRNERMIKVVGDSYYQTSETGQSSDYPKSGILYKKDGEEYSKYISDSTINITESEYLDCAGAKQYATIAMIMAKVATVFDDLDYRNNTYSISKLELEDGSSVTGLEITVVKGKIRQIKYTKYANITINNIGTTEI